MKFHHTIRRLTAAALALGMLLSLAACSSGSARAGNLLEGITPVSVQGKAFDRTFASSQYAFAAGLFRENYENGKNCMISPLSVTLALAMTANGASGQTLSQMLEVIGGGMPLSDLNAYLYEYAKNLPSGDKAKLAIADSIWLNDRADFTVNNDYLADCAGWYDAAIYKLPFDDAAVGEINSWVAKNTDSMIKKIVESIGPNDEMMLLNAICFDAKWLISFSKTKEATFAAAGGGKEKVSMMYASESSYLEGDGYTGFSKPYAEGYRFIGILPDENDSLESLIAGLDGNKLSDMVNGAVQADVNIGLPEFKSEYGTSLIPALEKLGMSDAFSGAADFSRMSSEDLYVSGVEHRTFIEVTKSGTRAAAVTGVTMAGKSIALEPKEVILDRPFLYMIVDNENGLPIFIGAVNSVK